MKTEHNQGHLPPQVTQEIFHEERKLVKSGPIIRTEVDREVGSFLFPKCTTPHSEEVVLSVQSVECNEQSSLKQQQYAATANSNI